MGKEVSLPLYSKEGLRVSVGWTGSACKRLGSGLILSINHGTQGLSSLSHSSGLLLWARQHLCAPEKIGSKLVWGNDAFSGGPTSTGFVMAV